MSDNLLFHLPDAWSMKSLEDVCSIRKAGKGSIENQVAHIPMEKIPDDGLYAGFELRKTSEIKSGVVCKAGDILLARITPSFENGKQGIVPPLPTQKAITTTEAFPLACGDEIDSKFLFYSLKRPLIRKILASRMTGSTGRQRIPADVLMSYRIPLPPLVEQRGIAGVLGTVDEAIQRTDAVIAKAEELKRGLMQRLLTRGIGQTRFKQTELGEIPETWEIKQILDVCEKPQYGYTTSALEEPVGPKFLRITDIQDGEVNWTKVPYCKCDEKEIPNFLLKKRDLVFARTGATTGKSYLITEDPNAIFASYLIRVRTNPGTDPLYLSFFFDSEIYWKQINQQRVGSAQGGVNASTLSSIKLPFPPLDEQIHISEIILEVERKIKYEKQTKQKLEESKKGLMQVLLSGKVRVRLDEGGLHRVRDG